jgi:hypothetical protein
VLLAKKAGRQPAISFKMLVLNHLGKTAVVTFTEDKFLQNDRISQAFTINICPEF